MTVPAVSPSTSRQPNLVTAEQLFAMERDGVRRELIDGRIRSRPVPGHQHGLIAQFISAELAIWLRQHPRHAQALIEVGFVIRRNPDKVLIPDIAVLVGERIPLTPQEGYLVGAPDIAVEVVSPNDLWDDVHGKAADWLAAGARQVWVVDPRQRRVLVHFAGEPRFTVLAGDDVLEGGGILPGLRIALPAIFNPSQLRP